MNHIAVIGLSTMGANIARNAARNGATVSVYNRSKEKTDKFLRDFGSGGAFIGCESYDDLAESFAGKTKAILLMVQAGAVDEVINALQHFLAPGDILIDGGNSFYQHSNRYVHDLAEKGIRFVGMGISGGEEGALNGPSMMPGGDRSAVEELMPLLEKMAASDGEGGTCVSYMGGGGAGHFVKMVHNGIEYGMMQLIAEAYDLLRREGKMSNEELAKLFEAWNEDTFLKSFLIEITAQAFKKKDPQTGKDLIDLVLDKAGQKGTGKWTTETALNEGVAIPTITAAVDARIVSSGKEFRDMESKRWTLSPADYSVENLPAAVRTALELSFWNAYAQGFQLMGETDKTEGWTLDFSEIARIWRGGCIIRSGFLPVFQKMFAGDKAASQSIMDRFSPEAQKQWREVVALGSLKAIPVPALSASLSYFDAYKTGRLPQNLIQAQRDLFGAHTFQRTDKEGTFHEDWGN